MDGPLSATGKDPDRVIGTQSVIFIKQNDCPHASTYRYFKNLVSFVVLRALCVPVLSEVEGSVGRRKRSAAQRTQKDVLLL
jgi:hypothetical protein